MAGTCFSPQHKFYSDGSWYSWQGVSLDVNEIDIDCLTMDVAFVQGMRKTVLGSAPRMKRQCCNSDSQLGVSSEQHGGKVSTGSST